MQISALLCQMTLSFRDAQAERRDALQVLRYPAHPAAGATSFGNVLRPMRRHPVSIKAFLTELR
jgi:hypothetical protein